MGKGRRSGGEGVDITWPDLALAWPFGLVYATPMLQHQARVGLHPTQRTIEILSIAESLQTGQLSK